MRLRKIREIALVAALVLTAACTKGSQKPASPEAALERYVHTAFSARGADDKQKLLDMSVAEARAYLEQMSAEEFKKQFVESSLQLISMKSKDLREENSGDVSLVYEIAFKDGKVPNATAYTNKKIAYLTKDEKVNGKIKATKNIKSFVERKDDLEILTPETTDKNAAPAK